MQSEVEQVKEVIEEDIWGNFLEFLNTTIIPIPSTGEEDIRITVGIVLLVILVFLVTNALLRGVRLFFTRKMPESDKLKFISVFKFIRYLVYVIVVVVTLSSTGIDITILLTASAALFVGLGFALQELFQDIIGGMFIIIDKSVLVGDVVEMDGKVGRVIDIKLRTTRLLTRDDKVMVIPNHKFTSNIILNYTQNHRITRELVRVGVAYGSDTELVKKILLESVKDQPGITNKPVPFVLFEDFGDSALIFSINFFITDSFVDPKIKSQVRYRIDQKFRESGVSIPFPQRDVHFYRKDMPGKNPEE